MKSKPLLRPQTLTLIIILVLVFYFWSQQQEIKRLRQTTIQQNQAYSDLHFMVSQTSRAINRQTELVQELMRKAPQTDPSIVLIVEKLDELAALFTPISLKVAMEIDSAGRLLRADQPVQAVATMAKILENILKTWFEKDEVFQKRHQKKSTINFGNLISHAVDKGLFTPQQTAFLKELKGIRNESAHELDVRKPKGYLLSCQEECIDLIKCMIPRFSLT
jgi:hypothetical protein